MEPVGIIEELLRYGVAISMSTPLSGVLLCALPVGGMVCAHSWPSRFYSVYRNYHAFDELALTIFCFANDRN
jgi:hypothetical protein